MARLVWFQDGRGKDNAINPENVTRICPGIKEGTTQIHFVGSENYVTVEGSIQETASLLAPGENS